MSDLHFINSYVNNDLKEVEGTLDCTSFAVVCAASPSGKLLAVGCNDGSLYIWNTITKNVVLNENVHVHPITSISWSKYATLLLTSSSDFTVNLICAVSLQTLNRFSFAVPINHVEFNPSSDDEFVACPFMGFPVAINIVKGEKTVLKDDQIELENRLMCARFDRTGDHLYVENGLSKVIIYMCPGWNVVNYFFITNSCQSLVSVIDMVFSKSGKNQLLVNCQDSVIRLYNCDELILAENNPLSQRPTLQFMDTVTRVGWRKCCFFNDGEYIFAACSRRVLIYFWQRKDGVFVKTIEGISGEQIRDMASHPTKQIFYTLANGVVTVWNEPQVQNWGAFEPDFTEFEENKEYDEREDEFDIEDQDKAVLEIKTVVQRNAIDDASQFTHCSSLNKLAELGPISQVKVKYPVCTARFYECKSMEKQSNHSQTFS